MNVEILNEIKIGEFTVKKTQYRVDVLKYESGNKFHFHVIDSATEGEKFHTCIELLDNRYYWHEGKTGVFNTKERQDLESFLSKQYTGKRIWNLVRKPSNWQALCLLWNDTNSIKIPDSIIKRGKRHNYLVIKPNQYPIPKKH